MWLKMAKQVRSPQGEKRRLWIIAEIGDGLEP